MKFYPCLVLLTVPPSFPSSGHGAATGVVLSAGSTAQVEAARTLANIVAGFLVEPVAFQVVSTNVYAAAKPAAGDLVGNAEGLIQVLPANS